MAGSAAITSSSKTLTTATYIATNSFVVGQAVIVAGLVTNAALNFATPRAVTARTGSQFSVGGFASGTVGSVSEAGSAIDPLSWLGENDTGGEWLGSTEMYWGGGRQIQLGGQESQGNLVATSGQGQIYPTGRN